MNMPSPLRLLCLPGLLALAACTPPAAFFAAPASLSSGATPSSGASAVSAASAEQAFAPIQAQTLTYAVTASVGDTVTLVIDENPGTGFQWELVTLPEQLLVAGREHVASPTASGLTGAPGVVRYRFTAAQAGQGTLVLAYRRSWETGKAPQRLLVGLVAVR